MGLVSAAGTQTKTYDYDAFGNEKDRVGADPNPFRYCGEYFDVESGAYYLRARYYDPSVGRFTQEDTHWNASNMIYGDEPQQIGEYEDPLDVYAPQITAVMQAGCLYGYCSSNPVKWIDPMGNIQMNASDPREMACYGGGIVWDANSFFLLVFGTFTAILKWAVNSGKMKTANLAEGLIAKKASADDSLDRNNEDISNVARQYGNLECYEAAQAMERTHTGGVIVQLYFPDAYNGYVVSNKNPNLTISENGTHYGYLYDGIVYCTVYPEGLPFEIWVQSFHCFSESPPVIAFM